MPPAPFDLLLVGFLPTTPIFVNAVQDRFFLLFVIEFNILRSFNRSIISSIHFVYNIHTRLQNNAATAHPQVTTTKRRERKRKEEEFFEGKN
jgi:hypothetical protein